MVALGICAVLSFGSVCHVYHVACHHSNTAVSTTLKLSSRYIIHRVMGPSYMYMYMYMYAGTHVVLGVY